MSDYTSLIERLRKNSQMVMPSVLLVREAADAITALLIELEALKADNASLLDSVTGEANYADELKKKLDAAMQELKNIANADTVAWDDPTQYEAWAKSRARFTLGKIADRTGKEVKDV